MQVFNEPDEPSGSQRQEAGEAARDISDKLNSIERAPALVYDLRLGAASSEAYYRDAAAFSDRVVAELELRAGP